MNSRREGWYLSWRVNSRCGSVVLVDLVAAGMESQLVGEEKDVHLELDFQEGGVVQGDLAMVEEEAQGWEHCLLERQARTHRCLQQQAVVGWSGAAGALVVVVGGDVAAWLFFTFNRSVLWDCMYCKVGMVLYHDNVLGK